MVSRLPRIEVNRSKPKADEEEHFSHSQLSMFLRCSQQYYYSYVKGIKIPPNINMASGSATHEALEFNGNYKLRTEEDMPIGDLLDAAGTSHDKFMGDVEDLDTKVAGKDKDESLATIGFYRRTQAPDIKPIAVEHPFTVVLEGDEFQSEYIPIIGYIDSYATVPDTREGPTKGRPIIALEDYKKVNQKRTQLEVDISPQLTLYDYVYNLQTEGLTTDVVGYRQLGFNGPRANEPGPFSVPIYRNPQEMTTERRERRWKRVLNQMKMAQRAINAGIFIPTDDPRTCSWCGYASICQVKPEG
jgi:CRISPR/Cas system-associated exonuclease Cas4 (RecB family)